MGAAFKTIFPELEDSIDLRKWHEYEQKNGWPKYLMYRVEAMKPNPKDPFAYVMDCGMNRTHPFDVRHSEPRSSGVYCMPRPLRRLESVGGEKEVDGRASRFPEPVGGASPRRNALRGAAKPSTDTEDPGITKTVPGTRPFSVIEAATKPVEGSFGIGGS